MRCLRATLFVVFLSLTFCSNSLANPFVVFPIAGELTSPDGHYALRSIDPDRSGPDFVGTFHSLWLFEVASGRARKLFDYVGNAAVAWASNDSVLVTEYVSKKTSRVLIFFTDPSRDGFILDTPTLIRMVPANFRDALRGNNHVFVEASRLEGNALYLRLWGYGAHDPHGFRRECKLGLTDNRISCTSEGSSEPH